MAGHDGCRTLPFIAHNGERLAVRHPMGAHFTDYLAAKSAFLLV
jgi:hypothetical protein